MPLKLSCNLLEVTSLKNYHANLSYMRQPDFKIEIFLFEGQVYFHFKEFLHNSDNSTHMQSNEKKIFEIKLKGFQC